MATRVGVRIPVQKKQRAGADVPAPADLPELVKASKAEDPAPEKEAAKETKKMKKK
jgi:hypothetical protein